MDLIHDSPRKGQGKGQADRWALGLPSSLLSHSLALQRDIRTRLAHALAQCAGLVVQRRRLGDRTMTLKSYRPNPLVSRSGGWPGTVVFWLAGVAACEESPAEGPGCFSPSAPHSLGTGGFSLL